MRQPISAIRSLAGVAAAAFLMLGCTDPEPPPNLLLLSIDTLRADHLGSYGYSRNTSPNLDRFASGAVRYANAHGPAPWTLPSHAAMLTGHHPYELGIVDLESSIPGRVATLAESLRRAGYQTGAFVDSSPSGLLGAERGFARGFDVFRHAPHRGGDPSPWRYDMARTVDAGLRWLDRRDPAAPYFLFLHTKSVHTTPADPALLADTDAPYDKPLPYRTLFVPNQQLRFRWTIRGVAGVNYLRFLNEQIAAGEFHRDLFAREKLEELIGLYDGGIFYVDHHFQRLLDGLAERGLSDDTVVLVTADHGEAFLEHVFFLHKELYSGLLHVPMILHDPRATESAVVERRVGLDDVTPTLLELAGVTIPDGINGSVLPRSDAEGRDRPFFSFFQFQKDYFYRAFALDDGPWKLVHHRLERWGEFRTELYDTKNDPGQERPIEGEEGRKREMLARLLQWTEEKRGSGHVIEIDPESAEQLRALGYLK